MDREISMNLMSLITAMGEYQRQKRLSDKEFAQALGIDRSYLSFIKHGKKQPGAKVLKAIVKKCPELRVAVLGYMSENPLEQPSEAQGRGLKRFCVGLIGRLRRAIPFNN